MNKQTEDKIVATLLTNSVTEAVIDGLYEKYNDTYIDGADDKDGYERVKMARIECKNYRVLAQKICKHGRKQAAQDVKDWIAKENEISGRIGELEGKLKKMEDMYLNANNPEEYKLQASLADKTNYVSLLKYIKNTPRFEFKSKHFRAKNRVIMNFIDDLK